MLKYTNMSGKRIFLIQSSGKTAEHTAVTFSDRTYADEVIKHSYYRHESWDTKTRDQDFGKVKVGDYILHYCTTDVDLYPGQIKNIYEVVRIERIDDDIEDALKKGDISKEEAERLARFPHVLRLRLQMTLNRGLELSLIRKWVEEGIFSTTMIQLYMHLGTFATFWTVIPLFKNWNVLTTFRTFDH